MIFFFLLTARFPVLLKCTIQGASRKPNFYVFFYIYVCVCVYEHIYFVRYMYYIYMYVFI